MAGLSIFGLSVLLVKSCQLARLFEKSVRNNVSSRSDGLSNILVLVPVTDVLSYCEGSSFLVELLSARNIKSFVRIP